MVFKAGQRVKVKSLGWFDENSSDNHLIEENFVMDRDFFEGVANKNVEIFDVDNKDNSVYVKLMVSTHMYGSQCEVLKTKVEGES